MDEMNEGEASGCVERWEDESDGKEDEEMRG